MIHIELDLQKWSLEIQPKVSSVSLLKSSNDALQKEVHNSQGHDGRI
jgi:hypothetical protein